MTLESGFFSPSSLMSFLNSLKIACATKVFKLFMKIRFDILFYLVIFKSIKHKVVSVIHPLEHLLDLILDPLAATYYDEGVVAVLRRHEILNHFLCYPPGTKCPILIGCLDYREVEKLSSLLKLGQVLIQDDIEL